MPLRLDCIQYSATERQRTLAEPSHHQQDSAPRPLAAGPATKLKAIDGVAKDVRHAALINICTQ